MSSHELAQGLHKPIIKKLEKRKVHSSFKDNIWGAGLTDMQLISEFNKRPRFLFSHMDNYSKYARFGSLKDNKSITTINAFQKHFTPNNFKPNKNMGGLKSWILQKIIKTIVITQWYRNVFSI